jgi:hypothetical protein
MTDEELAAMALDMVIDDINDTIHNEVGLAEKLEDQFDGLGEDEAQGLVMRLAAALTAVRDVLAAAAVTEEV